MGARSALEGELQKEKVDRWCLDVAKAGLQERVATQAAALVELEGIAEKLTLQCSDKAQAIQVGITPILPPASAYASVLLVVSGRQ